MIELHGRLTRAGQARSRYLHLPVEIPDAGALRVTLRHEAGNTIDLGLFEPGDLGSGSPAFRGWSGSERTEIWVGPDSATPGYRPGRIRAGTWHVLLGLYKVGAAGCAYRVIVEPLDRLPDGIDVETAFAPTERPWRSRARTRTRWYGGDLHCHTTHSDGADDVATVLAIARRAGLEFLAVTDHNTDSHFPAIAGLASRGTQPLPIAGEEITTYRGHLNAWGTDGWVDFRQETAAGLARAIDDAHDHGGLVSINHPAANSDAWGWGDVPAVDAVEVWNGPWSAKNEAAVVWWDELLRAGYRLTAVGGSDMHSARAEDQPVGEPVTLVRAASLTARAILDGIRAGAVTIARCVHGPRVVLRVTGPRGATVGIGDQLAVGRQRTVRAFWQLLGAAGATVRVLSARGTELETEEAEGFAELVSGGLGYLRLEAIGADGVMAALTNPIYLPEEDR